jgi:signal transduction histidine kinase/DNA-binding response OmpR family regulator
MSARAPAVGRRTDELDWWNLRRKTGRHMPQVLLIEDDPLVGRTLVDLLNLRGYTAHRVESAEQGLEALAEGGTDLVLLDVRLPGMDGFEACARIREAHGPSLPVIMMTAFGDPVAVRRGYEAGADDFLHKPIDTPALILKVRAFLRLKSMHDELARSREEAQARARDLARLHEIGRDFSIIAEPAEFNRMLTERLAGLIGAPIVGIALHDPATRTMEPALPVHGLSDEKARSFRYVPRPEYRSLWSPRSGRPYVSHQPGSDPRLAQEIGLLAEAQSAVLVPLVAEGELIGLLGAAEKPGGFTDADVQLLSTFAGPVATFLRGRQSFDRQRRQAGRFERLAALVGEMAAVSGRARLVDLTVRRVQDDLGYGHAAFFRMDAEGMLALEAESSPASARSDLEALGWALRGASPLEVSGDGAPAELAVPVRAGDRALGVLVISRGRPGRFDEEETSLLATLAGQLALALRRAESEAATEHLARQMATLYDLGLETAALLDLPALFGRATGEAGRLIRADHSSVFRFDDRERVLRLLTAWAHEPASPPDTPPTFQLGEGIAGRVARDLLPVLVNDAVSHEDFVPRAFPIARILCVPLTYFDRERGQSVLYGVLNATRRPGSAPFKDDDLDYLTRFAGQLSIAVANSVAFGAERERSEQFALVNGVLRETAAMLSRDRILATAVRRIEEALRPRLVCMLTPEPDTEFFRVAAAGGRKPADEAWAGGALSEGPAGLALRDRRTVLAGEGQAGWDPRAPGSRSAVAVPILSGGEVAAVLYAEGTSPGAFDRGQVITLETLADGIGILLRTAELYEALEGTNARLVELDRMKSELVNVVAHDFRAPLAAILGAGELLQAGPDAPAAERAERASGIVGAATRMARLMDRTLETTRLETGQFVFDFRLVDLAARVREAAAAFATDSVHPLVVDVPDEPLPCWADGERVAEVVDNLLSNAVKYSPGGGEIRLTVRRERETVVVSVSDRGIGIAPQDTDRLFRPFSRLHDPKARGIEGFGLGLSICDRFVQAHGGRLEVESVPGQGSTFRFQLPLFGAVAQSHAPVVVVASADAGTRRELRRAAEARGFAVHEVVDGVAAVETASRLRPAAVVLDRILPRLGAVEAAERLRGLEATRSVPLLVLSSAGELGEKASWFRECLPRPVEAESLGAALDRLATPVS